MREHVFVQTVRRAAQGDFGEFAAMQWLAGRGAVIAVPVGRSPDWDLIADLDGGILRIQVKTSSFRRDGRWEVTLCTRGGNQSWNGLVKRLDSKRFDHLYVHVADGRRWFIPAAAVGGGSKLLLGGPKYASFEVELGLPLPHFAADASVGAL
jgi:PD-(D/E)XK nuclease superfamily protein